MAWWASHLLELFGSAGGIAGDMRINRWVRLSALALLACALGSAGQSGASFSGGAFEVASVKPAATSGSAVKEPEPEKITVTPKGITMRNISLRNCLRWAYSVQDSQISGPGWMEAQRFDIVARSAEEAEPDQLRLMMQGLLAQRFRLMLRREAKEIPVYEMLPGKKGVRFQKSTGAENGMAPEAGALVFRNYSMADLAARLATRPFRLDRLVVDKTGLTGTFDFRIRIADDMIGMKHALEGMERGDTEQPAMIPILQEQLGLTFRPLKSAVESLVVESAEKIPTEN